MMNLVVFGAVSTALIGCGGSVPTKVTHETTKTELVATYDPKSLVVTVTYPTKLELHIHLSKASSKGKVLNVVKHFEGFADLASSTHKGMVEAVAAEFKSKEGDCPEIAHSGPKKDDNSMEFHQSKTGQLSYIVKAGPSTLLKVTKPLDEGHKGSCVTIVKNEVLPDMLDNLLMFHKGFVNAGL
jgi:hypothetical protein